MAERHTATGKPRIKLRLEAELERGGGGHPATSVDTRDDLSLCPRCGRDLVYPLEWAPAAEWNWSVALRCPECEWRGAGVFDQAAIDRFDESLDDGTQSVLDDLELLARANLEEQVESFIAALRADLVLPEDF